VAGPASRPGAAEGGRRAVAGVAADRETSDIGKRSRGVAELHRSKVRASASASITTADVSSWLGDLMRRGLARSTATRALATLRSLLSFAVADGRVTVNAAAAAKAPTGGQARREGRFLDLDEVVALAQACRGPYAELVYELAMQGVRWGELAGLQVGDRVMVPGPARGCGCHERF
jgi:site-specific recombinase XerD